MTNIKEETNTEQEGAPVCEKCGNLLIRESVDAVLGDPDGQSEQSSEGEWVCPHCQGEINFLGEDNE